jgi:biotin carboxyl carrier protein
MLQSYRTGSRHLTVAVQRTAAGRFAVTVDGSVRDVEATVLDAMTLRLVIDGRVHTATVVRSAGSHHVAIDGETYLLAPDAGSLDDASVAPGALALPQVVAPMPGKVLQVLVEVGRGRRRRRPADPRGHEDGAPDGRRGTGDGARRPRRNGADGRRGAVLVELDYETAS